MTFPVNQRRRWLEELQALRSRHPAISRIEERPISFVEGGVETAFGRRQYRLVFPPDYPLRPPSIWELRGDPPEIIRGRGDGHEFQDGSVCLFVHSAEDGWQSQYNAANALDRFIEYLEKLVRGEFPRVQRVPFEIPLFRVSMHPRIAESLRQGARWGYFAGLMHIEGRFMLIAKATSANPSAVRKAERIEPALSAEWVAALRFAAPWSGVWYRVKNDIDKPLADPVQFRAWLEREVPSPEARKLLAAAPAVLIVQRETSWFVFLNPPPLLRALWPNERMPLLYARVVEEDIPKKLFHRVDDRLRAADKIRQCQVAIVGLGSLGSSVAMALAKAGVRRFLLADPELLEPENVVRHVGNIHEIGLPKVEIVARAIMRINPDAEVNPIPCPLSLEPDGWGANTLTQIRQVAQNPKALLICTTATTEVERIINALAISEKCPAVFASVLGQAEHGRVFRVLPGKTPCLQCILQAQADDFQRHPSFKGQEIGVPAYRQPGIPGLGMDIDQVALIAARLALQTLAEHFVEGIEYPAAHADHFIWSNHGDWDAVDGPLQTRVERIARNPDCPVCGTRADEPLTEEEEADLQRLCGPSAARPAGS
jgi:molybdopterin/thiamine biosynthesis adenylyltransferase/ubiquitin-protein ligase